MYCKNCGAVIPTDGVFCPNCGTEVLIGNSGKVKEPERLSSPSAPKESASQEVGLSLKKRPFPKRMIAIAGAFIIGVVVCASVVSVLSSYTTVIPAKVIMYTDESGGFVYKAEYYDSSGVLIKEENNGSLEEATRKDVYQYDEEGYLERWNEFSQLATKPVLNRYELVFWEADKNKAEGEVLNRANRKIGHNYYDFYEDGSLKTKMCEYNDTTPSVCDEYEVGEKYLAHNEFARNGGITIKK